MQFHYEIYSLEQKKILEIIAQFNKKFILVGGTAIALRLGHRKSIDFDLFLPKSDFLPMRSIQSTLSKSNAHFREYVKESFHYEGSLNTVKCTRYAYPYNIPLSETKRTSDIRIPNPLYLAGMKLDALNGR